MWQAFNIADWANCIAKLPVIGRRREGLAEVEEEEEAEEEDLATGVVGGDGVNENEGGMMCFGAITSTILHWDDAFSYMKGVRGSCCRGCWGEAVDVEEEVVVESGVLTLCSLGGCRRSYLLAAFLPAALCCDAS